MKPRLKLSKAEAKHILEIVDLALSHSDGYWCSEIAEYNQGVPFHMRDTVNSYAQQVINKKLSRKTIESCL